MYHTNIGSLTIALRVPEQQASGGIHGTVDFRVYRVKLGLKLGLKQEKIPNDEEMSFASSCKRVADCNFLLQQTQYKSDTKIVRL